MQRTVRCSYIDSEAVRTLLSWTTEGSGRLGVYKRAPHLQPEFRVKDSLRPDLAPLPPISSEALLLRIMQELATLLAAVSFIFVIC